MTVIIPRTILLLVETLLQTKVVNYCAMTITMLFKAQKSSTTTRMRKCDTRIIKMKLAGQLATMTLSKRNWRRRPLVTTRTT